MQIIRCDSTHQQAWNAFVRSSPVASFYHRYEWREINERTFGHRSCYLAAIDDDQLIGVFPIVQVKSLLFGNLACSLPFVNFGGPCTDDRHAEESLLAEAAGVADEWNVDYLEIRSRRDLGERYPASTHKVSLTLDLVADPEELWNRFKTGHRQEIRRGYKNGFTAKFGGAELIDDFYEVLSNSWRDLGTPIFARKYLKEIHATFANGTRICVVYDPAGRPAAGAFDGVQDRIIEGMWLGVRAEFRRQLVGYVLYWELIKHACEQGFQRFHIGRSSADSGAEQFKKKWNATVQQLHWHYLLRTRADIPQLNPSNGKFRVLIDIWRRLPLPVTQHVGPMIARSIP